MKPFGLPTELVRNKGSWDVLVLLLLMIFGDDRALYLGVV
jgi:hypothetical protein